MGYGYIKLSRKIEESWLWDEKFSKGQAWIDLLLMANHKDYKSQYRGQVVLRKRGEVNRSIAFLSDRWKWDRGTVKRFLELLENEGMITQEVTKRDTTITILNYERYQGYSNATSDTTSDATTDTTTETTSKTTTDTTSETTSKTTSGATSEKVAQTHQFQHSYDREKNNATTEPTTETTSNATSETTSNATSETTSNATSETTSNATSDATSNATTNNNAKECIRKLKNTKQKEKEKKESLADVFNAAPDALKDHLDAFVEMRKKAGVITPRALKMIIKKLADLSGGDTDIANAILDQSTRNGWKDVFPLKGSREAQYRGRDRPRNEVTDMLERGIL